MAEDGLIPDLKLKNVDNLFSKHVNMAKLVASHLSQIYIQDQRLKGNSSTDLNGRMSTTSLEGANYYIVFKDDCSSYRFVYFLKNKSDVFSVFLEF